MELSETTSENQYTPEYIQAKLYFLLDKLKQMHANIPEYYQIRISYELLTELANCLVYDTVYEIVIGLIEIQHVTERHLIQVRELEELRYAKEIEHWKEKIKDPEELENILYVMNRKHAMSLMETDREIITMLDEKLSDQQLTLHYAGIPGFYVTNNPKEITIQMLILDFILRLSTVTFEHNKKI